jgi:hypothetical protein
MTQIGTASDISLKIAKCIVEKGENPSSDIPAFYIVKADYSDGRKLTATLLDMGNKIKNGKTQDWLAELRITLEPVRDDQWGFSSQDIGLIGEVEFMSVYAGKDSFLRTIHSTLEGDAACLVYNRELPKILEALSGK